MGNVSNAISERSNRHERFRIPVKQKNELCEDAIQSGVFFYKSYSYRSLKSEIAGNADLWVRHHIDKSRVQESTILERNMGFRIFRRLTMVLW